MINSYLEIVTVEKIEGKTYRVVLKVCADDGNPSIIDEEWEIPSPVEANLEQMITDRHAAYQRIKRLRKKVAAEKAAAIRTGHKSPVANRLAAKLNRGVK